MISQPEFLEFFLPIVKEKGAYFLKKALIRAKKAKPGTNIITKTSEGSTFETRAMKGDFLIENQTSSNEQYLMDAETFEKKYQIEQCLERGWASYRSKNLVMTYQVNESDFDFLGIPQTLDYESPLGKKGTLVPGDYLIIPSDEKEIYGIGAKEFEETYRQV
jgi:hypothetical protein